MTDPRSPRIMSFRRLIRNGWFWTGGILLFVTIGVFGYTQYLRQAVQELAREKLEVDREYLNILAGIHEETNFQAAWEQLLELAKHGQSLEDRASALPTPSDKLKQELSQRFGPELKALLEEIGKQQIRIEKQFPGGKEFIRKLDSLPHRPQLSSHSQGQTP